MERKSVPQGAVNRSEDITGYDGLELGDGLDPPPLYEELVEEVNIAQDEFNASARILNDGRVNINIGLNQAHLTPGYEEYLGEVIRKRDYAASSTPLPVESISRPLRYTQLQPKPPLLNIVIHVVGSRGDVQPFIALGKALKEAYQHRVRLATHPIFQKFVEENGLEFFSIGGDPASLMAFMVNNPSLMPTMESIKGGVISRRRKEVLEIMKGCWRSCFEGGDGTNADPEGVILKGPRKEFVADVIIANPPSFAHIHCAQKLGIPLQMMFTMPWSATQAFPHPLANIQPSNVDASLKNFMSYPMVEMMMWQGLGSTINMFRMKILDLEPVRILWGPKGVSQLKIPYSYLWSPSLIPKPDDWGNHISVTGFLFLPLASQFVPDAGLEDFLAAGPTPIYIGFGSIVVGDPNALLQLVLEAVRQSGQRAIISKGWGGLSADAVPKGVLFVDNVPHDWLFTRVSCVIHHGGAGTTAAGIRLGKPTVVIPFFGDQFFWGSTIARAGAGPRPIPFRELKVENLTAAIDCALSTTIQRFAKEYGRRIEGEQGADTCASTFHYKLDVDALRCSLDPSRCAVWKVRRSSIRLSAFSATVLIDAGLLRFKNLNLYRPNEYDLEGGPWDPITGTISACLNMVGSMMLGFADVPKEIGRARKANTTKLALTKNGTPSRVDNGVDEKRLSEPSAGGITILGPEKELNSAEYEGEYDTSLTYSHRSNSSGDADSAYSRELSASGSRSSGRKRDYQILRTSNGVVLGTSKAIGKIIVAGLKSPFEVSLSAAKGFHNVPRLYGDDTVRQHDRITGVWSGLKAAGKGLTFGVYDGVSGLWMQPIDGQKKEGAIGALKGVGKGIGGLALKPVAGTWGVIGYTFEGVNKEMQKLFGSDVETHIITSRKAQGFEDFRNATVAEKDLVLARWRSTGDLI